MQVRSVVLLSMWWCQEKLQRCMQVHTMRFKIYVIEAAFLAGKRVTVSVLALSGIAGRWLDQMSKRMLIWSEGNH